MINVQIPCLNVVVCGSCREQQQSQYLLLLSSEWAWGKERNAEKMLPVCTSKSKTTFDKFLEGVCFSDFVCWYSIRCVPSFWIVKWNSSEKMIHQLAKWCRLVVGPSHFDSFYHPFLDENLSKFLVTKVPSFTAATTHFSDVDDHYDKDWGQITLETVKRLFDNF